MKNVKCLSKCEYKYHMMTWQAHRIVHNKVVSKKHGGMVVWWLQILIIKTYLTSNNKPINWKDELSNVIASTQETFYIINL